MARHTYIHGTDAVEQQRLAVLNRLTNSAFIRFLELQSDSRVLDIGSGLGILAREVAEQVPRGHIVGVEPALAQLTAGNASALNLYFVQGDAHRLPFEDECFDVTYCRYVLEHVADPLRVLREVRRVMRHGGKVFVHRHRAAVAERRTASRRRQRTGPPDRSSSRECCSPA